MADGDDEARVSDAPGKRGRKANPPQPAEGPIAAFAYELWQLKRRAGDPSFATMCTRLGAVASRSSLAAATRGTTLPSWDTTWEFVRVLAVDQLGNDPEEAKGEWLARWKAAVAAVGAPDELGADVERVSEVDERPTAADQSKRSGLERLLRPKAGQLAVSGAAALVIVAVISVLIASSTGSERPTVGADPPAVAESRHDNSILIDETVPDGSKVKPGRTFTKVWTLRNVGAVRWEGRYLARVNSTDCRAPGRVKIPNTDPGEAVRVKARITAASKRTRCKIFWKMTDASHRLLFPDLKPIFLDVYVREGS